ncbi:AsmA family protein [Methylophilus flavus]|uniref:AsmA family protein n=1 Tax=Methylophilus flavus TaxID=640084 RepID=A0ABW3PG28_9PROT
MNDESTNNTSPNQSSPLKTGVKILRWVGGILLALFVIIVCCELAGWPFLRQPLQDFTTKTLKRDVIIERPFHLQLLGGLRLQVGHLSISAPAEFKVPYLVDAHGLDLKLRYRDLLELKEGQPYRIKTIRAEQLDAYMKRDNKKHATWDFELDDSGPSRPFPFIEELSVNKGQARIDDAVTKADLTTTFYTEEGAHLKTPESSLKVKGEFGKRPLQGELVTQGFLPVATQGKDSPPINSKGWLKYGAVNLKFDGAVYDLFGTQRVKGKLHVDGPSLADVGDLLDLAFPRTPPFRIAAEVEKNTNQWKVNVSDAKVGQSRLAGQFIYDYGDLKPRLTGDVKGPLLVLADLAPAFGAPVPTATGASNKKPGKIFPDETLDFATYDRMNADIKIHFDAVELGSVFKERIAPLDFQLTLQDRKLTVAKLYAGTAQGSLSGALLIDAPEANNEAESVNTPVPKWDIQLGLKNIQLEQWLKVKPEDRPAKDKIEKKEAAKDAPAYITGELNARAKLTGHGRSTAALLKSLDGQLALMVRDGEISHLVVEAAGLDIAQSVGLLLRGDHAIPMQCAAMGWHAKQGVLTPEAALIDTPVTTVYIHGNMDLGEEQFNLKLQANPKNFSPFTVRSPIMVTGPFVNPNVSISPGPIAARVAGGVLLALVTPFAAILPFLDPGSGDQPANEGCQQTLQKLKSQGKR